MKHLCCTAAMSGDGIATIIAAFVAALMIAATIHFERRRQLQARRAEAFAAALQAVSDYLEAPYRIRRRGPRDRGALSESISEIQSRLSFHRAHLALVAPEVGDAYEELLTAARAEAGEQMKEAWKHGPVRRDSRASLGIAFEQPRAATARLTVVKAMRRHT